MNLITPYKMGFVYFIEHLNKQGKVIWREKLENITPDVGLDYFVSAGMAGGSQYSSWYLGISATDYTPVAGETMTTLMTNAPENKSYSGTARKVIVPDAVADGLWSNAGTPLSLTFTGAATIRLAFLSSGSVWDSTTGLLISAVKFPSPRVITEAGEILRVVAGVQLVAA